MEEDWTKDRRAQDFYEACPFCGSEHYFGPEIKDSEGGDKGSILVCYECSDCGEEWCYWYEFLGTCWKDVNQRVVERLREEGKVVIMTDEIH